MPEMTDDELRDAARPRALMTEDQYAQILATIDARIAAAIAERDELIGTYPEFEQNTPEN